ncbi:MAG TPA: PilZ domain-containing protein [Candidatus Binatia bacterium]|nr:PilZ domain-containing protein [Candidatus Binatia bacterium]
MPDETNAGAAYLAALKRSTGSPAAQATAPALARDPGYSGREKRRSPRYKCQGSARIQATGGSITTWATFTDISMSGCYLEATEVYPVRALLTLKLECNGFRIEAAAEVKASYPQLGMGVSFTRMSEDDRERLRGLLRSIAPSSVILNARAAPTPPPLQLDRGVLLSSDPVEALQAIWNFFEDRHMMGRDEFLRILRKSTREASPGEKPAGGL